MICAEVSTGGRRDEELEAGLPVGADGKTWTVLELRLHLAMSPGPVASETSGADLIRESPGPVSRERHLADKEIWPGFAEAENDPDKLLCRSGAEKKVSFEV